MSLEVMRRAWDAQIASPEAKFLLVALAHYADARGFCAPGDPELVRATCMYPPEIRHRLVELEAAGLICRKGRAIELCV